MAKNKFYDALQSDHDEITLFFSIAYAYALMNKGLYHEMLLLEGEVYEIVENLKSRNNNLESITIVALFKNIIGNAYLLTSELDKAFNYYKESLSLRKTLQDESYVADSLLNIGLVYFHKGDYEKTLDFEEQALKKYKQVDDRYGILNTTVNLAILFYNQGKLQDAIRSINETMELATSYKNIKFISALYQLLGDIHENKGNLNEAIDNYEQSYKLKEYLGNNKLLGDILTSIGHLFIEKSDYTKALQNINKSIQHYLASRAIAGLNIATFWKFWIYFNLDNKTEMSRCLKELKSYSKNNQDQRTTQIYQIAQAIDIYHSNNSTIDETMANKLQGLLEEDKIIDIRLSIIAITILCSSKLFKLKTQDNKELKDEITAIIDTVYTLGQKNKSYKYMVISYILKTKFNLIIGNIELAFESVKSGLELAEKYELKRLIEEIKKEEEKLSEKIELWYTGIPVNPPLAEKIDDSKILDYLKEIMKIL